MIIQILQNIQVIIMKIALFNLDMGKKIKKKKVNIYIIKDIQKKKIKKNIYIYKWKKNK